MVLPFLGMSVATLPACRPVLRARGGNGGQACGSGRFVGHLRQRRQRRHREVLASAMNGTSGVTRPAPNWWKWRRGSGTGDSARGAMDLMYRHGGSTSFERESRLAECWRDLHTVGQTVTLAQEWCPIGGRVVGCLNEVNRLKKISRPY